MILMAVSAAGMAYILVFMAGSICRLVLTIGYFIGPSVSVIVDGDWVFVHNSFSTHTILRAAIVGAGGVERERVYLKTSTGRAIDVEAFLSRDSRRDQGRWRWRKTVRQTEQLMEVVRRNPGSSMVPLSHPSVGSVIGRCS
ncbi:hypothetical protein [Dactylosporangium sp. CA-233914]|uniref:hypothetical protein n=1 Tax=Dactylosporangium sp. CA-233914 TaxID=3239934 RepID=UPI003D8E6463